MQKIIKDKIDFTKDNNKLANMFGDLAKAISDKLNNDKITTTQFRQFYDKILELNSKAQNFTPTEFKVKILPFIKMLKSKVAYSFSRGHSGENFKLLMDNSIDKVNSKDELQNFKYFLESIIGYMPKK